MKYISAFFGVWLGLGIIFAGYQALSWGVHTLTKPADHYSLTYQACTNVGGLKEVCHSSIARYPSLPECEKSLQYFNSNRNPVSKAWLNEKPVDGLSMKAPAVCEPLK